MGEGVVLLMFLCCGFSVFFLKRFIGRFGCVVVSEGCGCVRDSATVSKGRGGSLAGELYPRHEKQTK